MTDICKLPVDAGKGKGKNSKRRWFFNTETNACEKFKYKGKAGNKNRFRKEKDCVSECLPPSKSRTICKYTR